MWASEEWERQSGLQYLFQGTLCLRQTSLTSRAETPGGWSREQKGTHLLSHFHHQLDSRAGASDCRPSGQRWVCWQEECRGLCGRTLRGCDHCRGQGAGELGQELRDSRQQSIWQRRGKDSRRQGHSRDWSSNVRGVGRRVAQQDLGAQGIRRTQAGYQGAVAEAVPSHISEHTG